MTTRRPVLAVLLALALASLLAPVPAQAADRPSLTARASEFWSGESVVVTGRVPGAKEGTKVRLYAVNRATGERGHLLTVTTSASGRYEARVVPTATTDYYVRVADRPVSRTVTVRKTVGPRTLTGRAAGEYKLGSARGGTKSVSRARLRTLKGRSLDKVRYRDFDKALLVEVTRGSTVRTWRVDGRIRSTYLKAGGPSGTIGPPRGDARCHLPGGGCVQRFENGAIYAAGSKVGSQTGTTRATELIATARSQLYYRSSRLTSKYNRWTGTVGKPWCGAFVVWAAAASGNAGIVPAEGDFEKLARRAKKELRSYSRNGTPKRGSLAFFDFGGKGRATHVGIVIKATKSTVYTIEGNASKTARFTAKRGVFLHQRPRSAVTFFADPRW